MRARRVRARLTIRKPMSDRPCEEALRQLPGCVDWPECGKSSNTAIAVQAGLTLATCWNDGRLGHRVAQAAEAVAAEANGRTPRDQNCGRRFEASVENVLSASCLR